MLILLLTLPYVLCTGLKAITYGNIQPVQTLVAFAAPSAKYEPASNDTEGIDHVQFQQTPQDHTTEYLELLSDATSDNQDAQDDYQDEPGQYLPVGSTADRTLVRRADFLPKRQRAPAFQGYIQIDCLVAPEVCQNVGWCQNCLHEGRVQTYKEGRGSDDKTNRVQSGVTTSNGTPCKTWPFGQMFWDTYPFNENKPRPAELGIQTDEWPTASMKNAAFDPTADPPQRSLRCMTGTSNGGGGKAWTNFSRGHGHYNRGGKWVDFRPSLGPNQPLVPDDTFEVQLNFESFKENNAAHETLRKLLTYTQAPFANCRNDGRQFHMTRLTGGASSGKLGFPYDSVTHNAYRLDYENADIQQYHIDLNITGDGVSAKVFMRHNGDNVTLATQARMSMQDGDTFSMKEDLPRALKVEEESAALFKFNYGHPHTDGAVRWFSFGSEDFSKQGDGRRYCKRTSGEVDGNGVCPLRLECSFPGW